MQITVNKTRVECIIDSGSSVNIMSANTYQSLKDKPALTYNSYNSKEELPILNIMSANTYQSLKDKPALTYNSYNSKEELPILFVTNGGATSFLSYNTAVKLGILHIVSSLTIDTIKQDFLKLFKEIGELRGLKVHLFVDKAVVPVA
ncbi:hypothetical protein QE152_g21662 [Popillia japonica]|uniref:Uncharacterized protein n=1 Tax=Popillia japonica TaxID=7064 RepID=A0AAW1KNF8_POPJA